MRIGTAFAAIGLLCAVLTGSAHGWSITYASGPDPAVSRWPSWPHQTVCSQLPFDPVGVFGGPTEAEQGQGAPEAALRKYLDEGLYAQVPKRFWRVVALSDTRAEFVSGRLVAGVFLLGFDLVEGRWKIAGTPGECRPRTVRDGNIAVPWDLVKRQRLGRASTRLRVTLPRVPCRGKRSVNEDAEQPEFRSFGDRLVMTIWLQPLPPGPQTCPTLKEPPLVVKLPGRLGARQLWDGATYPPRRKR